MNIEDIKNSVKEVLASLPQGVQLVAAAKARTPQEVKAAIEAGAGIIGENYVQEAEAAFNEVGRSVKWHFIGHLQKNKVKKAVKLFDVIETVDSLELASEINKRASSTDRKISVLIEVNSGREAQKFGVLPEDVRALAEAMAALTNIKVEGLMTMGPLEGDPEQARPYFRATKNLFYEIKAAGIANVDMKYLSMGMTNSYKVAIEEGANLVRLGTKLFGERET